MRFVFNEKKAAQAAAYLISLHGTRLNYTVLIKLLYLADRKALVECGQPITGDRMVSMPHGAVLSNVLDCVNAGGMIPESPWASTISPPDGYEVGLVSDPGTDQLSRYELDLLAAINEQYGRLSWWQLRQLTHDLPEWRDPQGSSIPIEHEEILRAEGKSPEEIERLTQQAEEVWFIDQLRARAS
jgi:uncharacterized phage-associated protein